MLLSRIYLTLCLILTLACGYFTGLNRFAPQLKSDKDLLITHEARTLAEFYRAVNQLTACAHFKANYKVQYDAMIEDHTVEFMYDATNILLRNFYAITLETKRLIVLTPLFFAEEVGMRESILAHELLHVVGFPNHVHKNGKIEDIESDPIYSTISECFPGY